MDPALEYRETWPFVAIGGGLRFSANDRPAAATKPPAVASAKPAAPQSGRRGNRNQSASNRRRCAQRFELAEGKSKRANSKFSLSKSRMQAGLAQNARFWIISGGARRRGCWRLIGFIARAARSAGRHSFGLRRAALGLSFLKMLAKAAPEEVRQPTRGRDRHHRPRREIGPAAQSMSRIIAGNA